MPLKTAARNNYDKRYDANSGKTNSDKEKVVDTTPVFDNLPNKKSSVSKAPSDDEYDDEFDRPYNSTSANRQTNVSPQQSNYNNRVQQNRYASQLPTDDEYGYDDEIDQPSNPTTANRPSNVSPHASTFDSLVQRKPPQRSLKSLEEEYGADLDLPYEPMPASRHTTPSQTQTGANNQAQQNRYSPLPIDDEYEYDEEIDQPSNSTTPNGQANVSPQPSTFNSRVQQKTPQRSLKSLEEEYGADLDLPYEPMPDSKHPTPSQTQTGVNNQAPQNRYPQQPVDEEIDQPSNPTTTNGQTNVSTQPPTFSNHVQQKRSEYIPPETVDDDDDDDSDLFDYLKTIKKIPATPPPPANTKADYDYALDDSDDDEFIAKISQPIQVHASRNVDTTPTPSSPYNQNASTNNTTSNSYDNQQRAPYANMEMPDVNNVNDFEKLIDEQFDGTSTPAAKQTLNNATINQIDSDDDMEAVIHDEQQDDKFINPYAVDDNIPQNLISEELGSLVEGHHQRKKPIIASEQEIAIDLLHKKIQNINITKKIVVDDVSDFDKLINEQFNHIVHKKPIAPDLETVANEMYEENIGEDDMEAVIRDNDFDDKFINPYAVDDNTPQTLIDEELAPIIEGHYQKKTPIIVDSNEFHGTILEEKTTENLAVKELNVDTIDDLINREFAKQEHNPNAMVDLVTDKSSGKK
jgi:hypothetical protein